mgnify:CR=1 FL=1
MVNKGSDPCQQRDTRVRKPVSSLLAAELPPPWVSHVLTRVMSGVTLGVMSWR